MAHDPLWQPTQGGWITHERKSVNSSDQTQHGHHVYLTQSAFRVVLQKSNPPEIRQRILCYS